MSHDTFFEGNPSITPETSKRRRFPWFVVGMLIPALLITAWFQWRAELIWNQETMEMQLGEMTTSAKLIEILETNEGYYLRFRRVLNDVPDVEQHDFVVATSQDLRSLKPSFSELGVSHFEARRELYLYANGTPLPVLKAWECNATMRCHPLDSDREIALKFLEQFDFTIDTTNQRPQLNRKSEADSLF